MSRRDLTKNEVDDNQPILLAAQTITLMRYVSVGTDNERDRVAGVKVAGYAYTLKEHPSDPDKFIRASSNPASRFYVLSIWDAFAADLLEYEKRELKRERKDQLFLVGPAGFIRIHDGAYVVTREQVDQVMSALPEIEGWREGVDENLPDEEMDANSLSI